MRRSKISMVFQHFALLPHRTVLDNAAYGARGPGRARAERRDRARARSLERSASPAGTTSCPPSSPAACSSASGLARALAADTDVLLMDEAFSALDPLIRREMQEQLVELQQELGKTIIFITHDLNEAMFLGDRIAVMRDGRIVQVGTPEEILTDPAERLRRPVRAGRRPRPRAHRRERHGRPRAVVSASAGPARARCARCATCRPPPPSSSARGRTLLGVVHDRDVLRLVQRRREATSMAIVDDDLATVAPTTPLVRPLRPAGRERAAGRRWSTTTDASLGVDPARHAPRRARQRVPTATGVARSPARCRRAITATSCTQTPADRRSTGIA